LPRPGWEDLEWADGFAFGTPTRFGNVSSQLKEFIDQTGPLWMAGKLADKAATSFTSAINRHGGQESTLLALNNTSYHWGAVIVAPGYTDPLVYAAGGAALGTDHQMAGRVAFRAPNGAVGLEMTATTIPGRSGIRGPRIQCVLCRRSQPDRVLRVPIWRTPCGNAPGSQGRPRGGVPYTPPEKRPGDPPLYGAVPEGSSTESRGVARSLRHLCSRARRLLE